MNNYRNLIYLPSAQGIGNVSLSQQVKLERGLCKVWIYTKPTVKVYGEVRYTKNHIIILKTQGWNDTVSNENGICELVIKINRPLPQQAFFLLYAADELIQPDRLTAYSVAAITE